MAADTGPARVLLVDDDRLFLAQAGDMLQEEGIECVTATSGRGALELLDQGDVVVTDIVMPDFSGIDLLREVRSREPLKPVICVSVTRDFSAAVEMVRNGAYDFLPKPLVPGQLAETVRRALQQYRADIERQRIVSRSQGWTRELLTLRQLGESSGRDVLSTLFRRTVEAVADTLRVQTVSLMLLQGEELQMVDAMGLPREVICKARVPLGKGISGWVAAQGQPLLINDINSHERFRPSTYSGQYSTQSAVCVPLKRGDRVLGVLNVNNKVDGNPFEQSELDLLVTVASQVSMAIDNARLFNDLEEKAADLERAHEELLRLDKDKTELILNISHELKTPLTALFGYTGLLQTHPGMEGEGAPPALFLKGIEEAGNRLLHLVDRMLELFRLEAGRVQCAPLPRKVPELVGETRAQLEELLEDRVLEEDYSALGEGQLVGDAKLLSRALAMVVENALKFSSARSPVTISARWHADPPPVPVYALQPRPQAEGETDGWVELAVTDRGGGMREKDIPRVFEKFRQLGDIMTEKPTGTGLGLSITRAVMELHGGTIWAESVFKEGSVFHLLLPGKAGP